MKKNLFALLSLATIIVAGCTDAEPIKIDAENRVSEEGSPVEQAFNKQIDETQYIKDLEDFISYDIALNTQSTPYISNISFDADFDKDSSVQWWLEFSWKNILKSKDLESIDIAFDLEARQTPTDSEPIYSSWDLTLLYQDNEMYANVHNFGLFMWEWNMTAKMYTLLVDMTKDNWINLEVNNWWIISVDKSGDEKIPHMMWTIKNILETKNIESSPDFISSLAEMIDTINSKIDLWISTNELVLLSHGIEYSELSDGSIQKNFTGSFQWKDSAFDLFFTSSKKWLDVQIYNIKEYDEDIQSYRDTESEFFFSIEENKKSDYSVIFQSIKHLQKVVDLKWNIKYSDAADFSADFVLEPLEIMAWQKISWTIEWSMKKEKLSGKEEFPTLSWEAVSINEILSSL